MDKTQYKYELKNFFANLSRRDSEAKKLKKINALLQKRGISAHLRVFVLTLIALFAFANSSLRVFAAPATLIPIETEVDSESGGESQADAGANTQEQDPPKQDSKTERYNKLARSFRTGEFEIWQIGDYVQYLIEFLIYIAGGLSVLFIVIGGYQYMIGSLTENKENGKKTIIYALSGFTICVLAWTIVNFTQVFLTSGDDPGAVKSPEKQAEESEEEDDCEAKIPPSIPDSCYAGDINSTQSKDASVDCEAQIKQLQEICGLVGASNCSSNNLGSLTESIQIKLGATKDGNNRSNGNYYYKGEGKIPLPANCSKSDGKYGQCTKQALENYFEENGC